MKNLNTVLNIVSLVAIGVLFFLLNKKHNCSKPGQVTSTCKDSAHAKPGQIAYFEMDSVEKQYKYIKDVRNQLKSKEQAMSDELDGMKKNYMARIQQLQAKASTMSQQEGEAAQVEINQMQQTLQQKESRLAQELQEHQFKLMQDIGKKIEDYLKTYNQQKQFSYIFSRQSGDFIYFKDSTLDITSDIVKGLNDNYKK